MKNNNLFRELFELRQLIVAFIQRFSVVVYTVDEDPQGKHVAGLTAAEGKAVLWSHVVQTRLSHGGLVGVPLVTWKCGLKSEEKQIIIKYMCVIREINYFF